MNNEAYKVFQKMKIDEEKEIMDISDHNLVTLELEIATRASNGYREGIWEEVVYYSRKDLETFTKTMEDKLRLEEVSRIEDMNRIMNEVKEDKLKRRYRR